VESLEAVLAAGSESAVTERWARVDAYILALGARYAPGSTEGAAPAAKASPAEVSEVAAPAAQTPEKGTAEERPEAPETAEAPTESAEAAKEAAPVSAEGKTLVLEETPTGETIAFDPNEAANALGLPESLIIEFVNDFVSQARDEKQTFVDAFAAGDLKRVNETAHKLKGVAANLRIEEMRELMEQAQHAATFEEAEKPLVAFYKKLAALSNTMAKEFA
jgi:HPt (histidine-containing phosphotransfer) domain-containing protein